MEIMTNCAKIVHTKTNEGSSFWNKRASPITITADENKMRNANKQKSECPWFLSTEKQTQKRAKNKIQWNHLKQWNLIITKRICGVYALDNNLSDQKQFDN